MAPKRGSGWEGYKVHLSETCDPDEVGRPHVIAHIVTTDATVGDAAVVEQIHDRLDAKGLLPSEHFLDSGCISAELLLTSPVERGVEVVGPVRPNSTRQAVQAWASAGRLSDQLGRPAGHLPQRRQQQVLYRGLRQQRPPGELPRSPRPRRVRQLCNRVSR
ncbi:hypothetical protein ABZS94_35150 [Streptomyces sp. NPDC005500]|uniref:hypothetical protein n=1 Tax=Streptomyces sp. NPDC005500 TaxID=3155007 RepID=UPI0033B75116